MRVGEIKEKYKGEWILIINPVVSAETKIVDGDVAFHSKDRGEVHRKLSDFKGNKALIYAGEIPEDVEVLL